MDKSQSARRLLLKEGFGVLSTISLDVPGYPFGSITPYCMDEQCRPVIYISRIAQHTRNIIADSRVSLTVVDNNGSNDVQAHGRVTCVANARPVAKTESAIRERYFRYFPSARQYDQTHDFDIFRLELVRVRFIGGFGEIFWVEPAEFMTPNPFSAVQEMRIVEHMNNDHREALNYYAGGTTAMMSGIDSEGFDLLAAGRKLRFDFDTPVLNMEQAREAFVAMAKRPA